MDRVSTILADTILIIITWKRVMPDGVMNASRRFKITKIEGLASVLLRDGMLYFVVLLCLNIIQLVLTELSVELDDHSSLVGLFISSVSSVLVSHFLLDLQEAHQRKAVGLTIDDPLHTSQSLSIRSVKFMPALGSLAATIDHTDYGREDGDQAMDEDHYGVSEDVPTRSDGSDSTGSVRVEDQLTIAEVPRSGAVEFAVWP